MSALHGADGQPASHRPALQPLDRRHHHKRVTRPTMQTVTDRPPDVRREPAQAHTLLVDQLEMPTRRHGSGRSSKAE